VPERDVLYLTAGTMNMDPRSAMLDGEAMAVVAGAHAAQAFMDFVLLTGGITWVQSVEQAGALLPPKSRLQRWVGRVLHPGL
jgi:phosphatidylserine/phosphatidylglycerophosphate/cardiolipin synthase-like enzyme